MGKKIYLLLGIVGLFLLTSLVLNLVYGPSYPFLAGEDCWIPDGNGGWLSHGHPDDPAPIVSSTNIPFILQYLPIFLPALLLILFTLTPLSRKLR
jgi:hypothetical protein